MIKPTVTLLSTLCAPILFILLATTSNSTLGRWAILYRSLAWKLRGVLHIHPLPQNLRLWAYTPTRDRSVRNQDKIRVWGYWLFLRDFFELKGYVLFEPGDKMRYLIPAKSSTPDAPNRRKSEYPFSRKFYERDEDIRYSLSPLRVWPARDRDGNDLMIRLVSGSETSEELAVWQRLHSPALKNHPRNRSIPVLDYVHFDGLTFIVMPRWDCPTSQDFATVEEILYFAECILDFVDFLHENRILHRDLTEQNICVNVLGSVDEMYATGRCDLKNALYAVIDFGHSVAYPLQCELDQVMSTLAYGTELGKSSERNPFQVEMYWVGMMLNRCLRVIEEFVPEIGPYIDNLINRDEGHPPSAREALEQFHQLTAKLGVEQLKAPLKYRFYERGKFVAKTYTIFDNPPGWEPTHFSVDARFAPYLLVNDLAPPSVLSCLQKLIKRPQKAISVLDEKIRDLDAKLNELRQQRSKLYKAISVYDPIFSPIRILPDDILAEIFVFCLPSDRNPVPFHLDAPLVLSLVCRKWRAISQSTPKLWARLHVTIPFNDVVLSPAKWRIPNPISLHDSNLMRTRWADRAHAFKTWIQKSACHPLSLSVYVFNGDGSDDELHTVEPIAHDFLSFIKSQRDRWYDMEFSVPLWLAPTLFFDPNIQFCQQLHSFKLRLVRVPDNHNPSLPTVQQTEWLSGQSLRTICISQPLLLQTPPYLRNVNWSSISQLSLDVYGSCRTQLLILHQCNNLEHCFLRLSQDEADRPADGFEGWRTRNRGDITTLPKLKTLILISPSDLHHVVDFHEFYDGLSAPNLVNLSLLCSTGTSSSSVYQGDAIEKFMNRCLSLHKLTIDLRGLDHILLPRILRAAPFIRELSYDTHERLAFKRPVMLSPLSFSDSAWRPLQFIPDSNSSIDLEGMVCPQLTTIKVYGLKSTGLDILKGVLKSRIRQGPCTSLEVIQMTIHDVETGNSSQDFVQELEDHSKSVGRKVEFNILRIPEFKVPATNTALTVIGANASGTAGVVNSSDVVDWRSQHMWGPLDVSDYM
ncbi:hypothetical protein CVT24_000831 [Panaeolus cyanescens]|uniref:Protein kinase domain-containing protein n=1 Tax=Panaeolus cyanescens TaxID=181874 RepID=A0A409VWS6_9AGAR|nr:hypothetical protein CVT24_000831 [Panaeolus cyanescens]